MTHKKLSARILSLVLTAAMVGTMMPSTALAAEGDAALGTSGIETTTRTITAFDELGEGYTKSVPFDGHTYAVTVKLGTPIEEIVLPAELGVTVERTTTTTTPPAKDEVQDSGKAPENTAPADEPTSSEPIGEPEDKTVAETPAADEPASTEPAAQVADMGTTVSDNEPATPSDAELAPTPEEKPDAEAPPADEPEQDKPEQDKETTATETAQETIPVTWKGDREYTPDQNSKVIYTPVLPEGYALADGVALPTIYVMVGKQARATDIASGTSGNCDWVIDADGVLTISPKSGMDGVLGITGWNSAAPWKNHQASIKSVVVAPNVKTGNSASYLFEGLDVCTTMDLSGLDTTAALDMSSMFSGCDLLETITFGEKFNTAKVTDMSRMFNRCTEKLTSLDLSGFDTSNVKNMYGMFNQCMKLTSITFGDNFNTANVTDMDFMFYSCSVLTSLDLSGFDITKVENMSKMFGFCSKLTSLDLSGLNATSVKNMTDMFYSCSALTSLDLSGFDTANVTDMKRMFLYCNSIESIKFGEKFIKAVDLPIPVNLGPNFTGWYTTPECTGDSVVGAKGGSYGAPANTTVYSKRPSPSIKIAAQTGTATYGTVATPTFTVTNSNFGNKYPEFTPRFEWVGIAPADVTTTFSADKGTLTMNTTAATPAGEYKFKVISAKAVGETGNYESAEATLTVDQLTATITWDSTTSFTYNGSVQAPTATVGNKVTGDDVTITVTGGETAVGSYTATAEALAGDAANNYKLPTAKPTKAFTITAKTVTVTDGTLEVKKAYDGKIDAGTATGKLGLTGVVGSDDVSVKIDTIGAYADANVGKNKTVTLTISLDGSAKGNYTLGSTSYSFDKAEITKVAYTGTAARAPDSTPENKGDKSITIKPVTPPNGENVEYAVSKTNTPPTSDSNWQTSTTFDNLDPNTEYFFFARVKENENHAAGGVNSSGTSIKTDKSVYTGTQATAPTATKTHNTVTLNTQTIDDEAVEYGYSLTANGEITWRNGAEFTGLTPNTAYFFFARVKENNTHKAGATSAGTAITTKPKPTTVSGNVKDSNDSNLDNVLVELKQGDTVIKSATTTDDGNYILNDVPAGVYNLVITKGTAPNTVVTTQMITVAGTAITNQNVKFDSGKKNTVVESKDGAPDVAVGGMNDLLNTSNIGTTLTGPEKTAVDAGGSVELKFTADLKAASDVPTDKSKIEAIATGKKIDLLLDLSVLKTVKDGGGITISNGVKITTLADLIEVYLPIPAELQGKAGLSLYRVHNGTAQALNLNTPDGNNEYYTIDSSKEFMTLRVKNFSTYALGYDAFTVTLSGGGTGASGNGNYSNGDTVTINAGTKSNYSFNGWTVTTGTVTLANPSNASTTFTMPSENVTVTAGWTYTGGSTGGSGSGGGSSYTYYYIKATADPGGSMSTPERVKVRAGESAGFTITPNKGYQIEDVLVNGKSIGAKTYYAFTNVHSDQTIHASFKKIDEHKNPQTGVSFDDVQTSDWFYDAVMEATANGWFNGTSDTTFSPNAPTSRGMIATILHRIENTPGSAAASFTDVASDAYYANGVAWAQEHGIVTGYGNGNYGPNDSITREQLASILYRYAGFKGYDVSKTAALGSFTDASSVSGYAKDSLSWAVGSGLISGRGNNTLVPTATATRAEVAVILVRFEKLFIK